MTWICPVRRGSALSSLTNSRPAVIAATAGAASGATTSSRSRLTGTMRAARGHLVSCAPLRERVGNSVSIIGGEQLVEMFGMQLTVTADQISARLGYRHYEETAR
jgi:hypothetical protein